jgi:hypothetical protein
MLDLSTVRETLHYMKDDLSRVPELKRASDALAAAIDEIEKVERTQRPVTYETIAARFLPRGLRSH